MLNRLALTGVLLVSATTSIAELEIDAVKPTLGQLGSELVVNVAGADFSSSTRASITYQAQLAYRAAPSRWFRWLTEAREARDLRA